MIIEILIADSFLVCSHKRRLRYDGRRSHCFGGKGKMQLTSVLLLIFPGWCKELHSFKLSETKHSESTCMFNASQFPKCLAFWKVPRLLPFVLVEATYRWRRVWSMDGIIMLWESQRTRRKPVPVPLCSPQTSYKLTRDRTRASAMTARRPTTWAITRPKDENLTWIIFKYSVRTAQ